MKKAILLVLLAVVCAGNSFAQFEDRLNYLTDAEAEKYITPLATTMGVAFNSAAYTNADISDLFGFSFSIRAMAIMIPESDQSFVPEPAQGYDKSEPTATIYGNNGNYYAGPDGYQVYPPGINETTIPMGFPQIGFSVMSTEVLVRYLPNITVGETEVGMFGLGVSHNISRYFPGMPVDVAAQILYNGFTVKDILDINNIAFNVHPSKTFGLFTAYSGLQYENTTFDLTYTYKEKSPVDPNQYIEKDFTVNANGENHFRFTLGGAIKLAVVKLNADINVGSQFAVTSGLSFEF
jgi:hypothetical protein